MSDRKKMRNLSKSQLIARIAELESTAIYSARGVEGENERGYYHYGQYNLSGY
jgi:hypothetical protein